MVCFAHAVIDALYLSLFHVKQLPFTSGAGMFHVKRPLGEP